MGVGVCMSVCKYVCIIAYTLTHTHTHTHTPPQDLILTGCLDGHVRIFDLRDDPGTAPAKTSRPADAASAAGERAGGGGLAFSVDTMGIATPMYVCMYVFMHACMPVCVVSASP